MRHIGNVRAVDYYVYELLKGVRKHHRHRGSHEIECFRMYRRYNRTCMAKQQEHQQLMVLDRLVDEIDVDDA